MPLAVDANDDSRRLCYQDVEARIESLLEGEQDWIAALATVAAELHGSFAYFNWTGFYRLTTPAELVIGPYQGGHGCLRIPLSRGVCGTAAATREIQRVGDVSTFPGHIACAASTQSEIVVPIVTPQGRVLGVLDVDSDFPAAFSAVDEECLARIVRDLARRFQHVQTP